MKNSTLFGKVSALIAFLCLSYATTAQIYLTEDFNGGFPAGWTTIDGDGANYNAGLGGVFLNGPNSWVILEHYDNVGVADSAIVSSSWYDPVTPADDWLITPQVTLGANSEISYDEKAQDPGYPDGYELRISTTTPDIPGFMANPVVYSVAAGANPLVNQTFNLSGYAGQSVYFAWHNNSTDQFTLMIDNVSINEVSAATFDVAMSDTTREYTIIPLSQVTPIGTSGEITEVGGQAVTGATMTVNVYDGTMANVYTASSAGSAIGVGGSITTTVAGYTPTAVDVYTVELIASITEVDANLTNDTVTYQVLVDDGFYARDDATPTINLGIGTGSFATIGCTYEVINPETMDSVFSFHGASVAGDTLQVEIYDMVGGLPSTQIGMSDFYIISTAEATAGLVNHTSAVTDMSGNPLALAAGNYFVGIKEFISTNNYSLAHTDNLFTYGTVFGTINGGAWATLEALGFPNTPVVRPHFASCPATSSTLTESACETYTWAENGMTYTTSGQYTVTIPGANACGSDSVVILDLTINTPDAVTETVSECATYTWSADGMTYTTTGTYTATLPNMFGCDSVITLDLTIGALDNTTTTASNTITANQANAAYQWIDCGNGNAVINGETNQAYTATANGDFAVIITSGTCVDTSACVTISGIGLEENVLANNVEVYPNPSNGNFTVMVEGITSDKLTVSLTDALGKEIMTEEVTNVTENVEVPVQMNGLNEGMYFVKISSNGQSTTRRVIITK
jgi:hypothetical protein